MSSTGTKPCHRLLDELRRHVRSPVLTSPADVEPMARDWGGILHRFPLAVVRTHSETEVRAVLSTVRAAGVPVRLRGTGHSSGGQSLGSGVVLENHTDRPQCRLLGDGTVEVSGRTTWRSLVAHLEAHGRTVPVVTRYPGVTVGGTLAVGGYGPASIAHGTQVDQVRRLRLVLPDGIALWCSPEENPDLFSLGLAGLGQIGVIERAVLATVPAPSFIRLHTRRHDGLVSLGEVAVEAALLAAGAERPADYFYGEQVNGVTRSYVGYAGEALSSLGPTASAKGLAAAGQSVVSREFFSPSGTIQHDARTCHVWCDYLLPAAALPGFLRLIEDGLRDGRLLPGPDRIFVLAAAAPAFPGRRAYPPPGGSDPHFGVGVFYSVSCHDPATVRRARQTQRLLLQECLGLGGRPYLAGAHSLDGTTAAATYCAAHEDIVELRDRLDPSGLFNRLVPG